MKSPAPNLSDTVVISLTKVDSTTQLKLLGPLEPQSHFFVRESSRARQMSIKVHPFGRVEVVVPRRTKPHTVESFVRDHQEWIRRATREMSSHTQAADFCLPDTIRMAAVDRTVTVHYETAVKKNVCVRETENGLFLTGLVSDEKACIMRLKQWLADTARQLLVPWLERRSHETGLSYKRVQVRGQRTRWGSYSSSGTLCVNYNLLFLAPELVDYLFIHELCHVRHLNHSARYWRLVGSLLPDCRRLDRDLGHAWKDVPGWVLNP